MFFTGAGFVAVGTAIGGVMTQVGEPQNLLIAEHAGLYRSASTAYSTTLNGGQTREMYLRGERLSVYLHPIKGDYFLLLAVDARSNLGQARLYGRDTARKLEATL